MTTKKVGQQMVQQAARRGAQQRPEAQKIVVVHVKLTAQERNALKAILSLEGSTMQAYFAAKAVEKITSASGEPSSTVRQERSTWASPGGLSDG
jgi:hypothetical protein